MSPCGVWWRRSVTMTISDMMCVLFHAMFYLVDFEFRSVMFLASSCMELVTAFCDCVDFR
uniref:Uncharacterized protein n=1 Tax=Helianthus annuus TaxID=4232 RepID=A0A251TYG3_HELAN